MTTTVLRLLTYLAPSIPLGLYETIGDYLAATLDVDVEVHSETGHSGPGPHTDNPFADGDADVGFVCAPSYTWLSETASRAAELVGVAPVHDDSRNEQRAVYFSELVVRPDHGARSFDELQGSRFAFNDDCSLSGYFSVLDRLAARDQDESFFGDVVQSGSHLRSLDMLADGTIDCAAIDANTLHFLDSTGAAADVRVLETLGPFAVQPVIVRSSLDAELKQSIADALLHMHYASGGEPLRRYGVLRFAEVDDAHYADVRQRMKLR